MTAGGRASSDDPERELASRLRPGEVVLARGRFDAPAPRARDLPTGGHRFLLVTDHQVLWSESSIDLDAVTLYTEMTQSHRYAIRLRHPPMERSERVPAHRVLWWRWGTTIRPVLATETTFVFSRRDTRAARELRHRLAERGVHSDEPVTLPRLRPEGGASTYLERRTSGHGTPLDVP